MKLKKNPKADLTKDSSLYFAIGLTFVLFFTWQSIEWKTYEKSDFVSQLLSIDDEDEEEIPITEHIKTPPPPLPPPAPEIIEIIDNDKEVKETEIESTETDQDEITDAENIEVEADFDEVDVPFVIIEEVPIFPGCEDVTKSEQKECFQKMIFAHINKTVRYPEIAQEMEIQGKVYMRFVIERDGSITNIEVLKSPDRNLEKEAIRIINKLPKMIPGKQRGRPVRVPFSIPITFRLN